VSRRNDVVNKITQGSSLYQSLNLWQRRTLVALLKTAYSIGAADAREDSK
jgi:hypothetical protein